MPVLPCGPSGSEAEGLRPHSRLLVLAALTLGLLAFAAGPATPGPARAQAAVQGDVNCDGNVNAVDSLQVLRSVAGLSTNAGCLEAAGDVDCSGALNSVDALRILRHVAALANAPIDGCTPIGQPLVPQELPPTSEELIAAALAAGEITYEESLLYRAYALYDDPHLPEEYRSPVVNLGDLDLIDAEVEQNRETLSPALLGAIEPFLARPNDPISVFNTGLGAATRDLRAQGDPWISDLAAGGTVRVWVRSDQASLDDLAELVALVDSIAPHLDLLFRDAIPDAVDDDPANPDSAVDLYYLRVGSIDPRLDEDCRLSALDPRCRLSSRSSTRRAGPRVGNTTSGYALVDLQVTGVERVAYTTLVLAYLRQFAYDSFEDEWLRDSTASFAVWYVLDQLDLEKIVHRLLPEFFQDFDETPLTAVNGSNEHAAYLYFFHDYLEQGDAASIDFVWQEAAKDGMQGKAAVDLVIPFDPIFREFALKNWNRPPVDDWERADGIDEKAAPRGGDIFMRLQGTDSVIVHMETGLLGLTQFHYRFFFDDPAVRSVEFKNTLAGLEGAGVNAIIQIEGQQPRVEDWSDEPRKTFCRDQPDEDIRELVLVFSNSNLDITNILEPEEQPTLEGKPTGCTAWEGTVTSEILLLDEQIPVNVTVTQTASHVRFDLNPDHLGSGRLGFLAYYELTMGQVSWTENGTWGECTVSGSGVYSPLGGDQSWLSHIELWDDGAGTPRYEAVGFYPPWTSPDPRPQVTFSCPEPRGTYTTEADLYLWLEVLEEDGFRLEADGTMRGTLTRTYYDLPPHAAPLAKERTWTWELRRVP